MKIARIDKFDITNGKPFTDEAVTTIWFQGCNIGCKDCQNPELQSFDGIEMSIDDIVKTVNIADNDWIVFLGGEPLDQSYADLFLLASELRNIYKRNIALYTGYTRISIGTNLENICDFIKYGMYRHNQKRDGFPSSENQKAFKRRGRDGGLYEIRY